MSLEVGILSECFRANLAPRVLYRMAFYDVILEVAKGLLSLETVQADILSSRIKFSERFR